MTGTRLALLGALILVLAAPAAASADPFGAAGSGYPFNGSANVGAAPVPAWGPTLVEPVDVAALPDGGMLVADLGENQLDRVTPDGRIAVLAHAANGVGRLGSPTGVAVAADGTWLVASANAVFRVAPTGAATRIAGTGTAGFAGDGGPALSARLRFRPPGGDGPFVTQIAPLAGGGFLIADDGNDRIRRVAADGTISTVAGGGAGPALKSPEGVVALPDGGFAVADTGDGRVIRYAPDATATVLATGLNQPTGVTRASDGSFAVSTPGSGGIARIGADGGPLPSLAPSVDVSGRGFLTQPMGLATTPDGGLLAADAAQARVEYAAPASPTRLAVAIRALQRGSGSLSVGFDLTRDAAVDVTLAGAGGPAVATVHLDGHAGANTATLSGKLPTRRATVTVSATAGGTNAGDQVHGLALGGHLTRRLGASLLDTYCCGAGDEEESFGIVRCNPLGPARMDCQVDDFVTDLESRRHRTTETCLNMTTLSLAPSGVVTGRDYRCPKTRIHIHHRRSKFRRPAKHPHYTGAAYTLVF